MAATTNDFVAYAVRHRGKFVKAYKRLNHATAYVTRNTKYTTPEWRAQYEVVGLVEGAVVRRYDE